MSSLILAGCVLVTWIVHCLLSGLYRPLFDSTFAIQFRVVHVLEIFVLTCLMIFLYKSVVSPVPPITVAVAIVLAVLIILDGILLFFFKDLRATFDVWHFAAAYTAVVAAVVLVLK